MREIIESLRSWFNSGQDFTIATVTRTWSSAPRPIGAVMAVSNTGEIVGSVSGGCVEGALFEASLEVMKNGVAKTLMYGVSDDDALQVGLTCGGTIELFIQLINKNKFPNFIEVADAIANDLSVAIATVTSGNESIGSRIIFVDNTILGSFNNSGLDSSVKTDVSALLNQGISRTLKFGKNGERRMDDVNIFVESFAKAPRMIVFGAIDFAAAVARIGKFLGYYVIVCDARPIFATKRRFPDADEIIVSWPHKYLPTIQLDQRTAICVLTHDPKFDIPLLELALKSKAGYIGAMGSRRTHEDRLNKLREIGITESEISRLRSPIGLDLGARTPEETAVSIAAEIISDLCGGTNKSLSTTSSLKIHKVSLASENEIAPKLN
jgi:xanthine dehydrogenase accessory factor